jgi:hypothetical protein
VDCEIKKQNESLNESFSLILKDYLMKELGEVWEELEIG